MSAQVNGAERPDLIGATITQVVDDISITPKGIAVAVNGSVVPRSRWGVVVVGSTDEVEVLTAAQGG